MDYKAYYNELIKNGEEIKNKIPKDLNSSRPMEELAEWFTKCLRLMQDILPQGKKNTIYENFENASSKNSISYITRKQFEYNLGLLKGLKETIEEYEGVSSLLL